MRDVTKFPNAQATVRRSGVTLPHDVSKAALRASVKFAEEHGRLPDPGVVRFRGSSSAKYVTLELWEEP